MSGLDLDALLALCDDATPGPWVYEEHPHDEFGYYSDVSHAPGGDIGDPSQRFSLLDRCEDSNHRFIAAAREAVPALVARLRAAEARTAWQPIETAPVGAWVLVYGTRFRAALPSVEPARLDEYGWADKVGYSVRPTHWMPLPAAPEAP